MGQMARWKVQSRHKSVSLCLHIFHLQYCFLTLRAEGEGKTQTVLICCNSLKSRAAGWVIEFPPQKKTKGLLRTGRRGGKMVLPINDCSDVEITLTLHPVSIHKLLLKTSHEAKVLLDRSYFLYDILVASYEQKLFPNKWSGIHSCFSPWKCKKPF